jgi:hypothetical protein
MGDWKRTVGFAVAIACIGLSLFLPWWQIGDDSTGMSIKLREVEVCFQGTCEDVETGGMYGVISLATFVYGLVAIIVLILGGLLPALGHEPTRPSALLGATIYLGLAGFTIASIPDELLIMLGARKTIWYWCAIVGPLAAIAAPIAAMIGRERAGQGKPILYRPPDLAELKRDVEGAPAPAAAAPAAPRAKAPSMPVVHFAPVPGMAPTQPSARRAPIELEDEPAPPPVPFALAAAEVREHAVIGIDADGRRRELRWTELGGALARELDDTLLIDLVPAGAPPLRFVAATRLEFEAGGGSTVARDQLRRLLGVARAMNPELQLEAATAGFLDQKAPLPTWSLAELARYDERYRR